MNEQKAKELQVLQTFADLITLVYHEGRNVRYLVPERLIERERYVSLIHLPENRVEAWRSLQKLRIAAKAKTGATQVEEMYSRRFGLTLEEMKQLFQHQGWKDSKLGGNKWAAITDSVILLRSAIVNGRIEEAEQAANRTLSMCHHNGRVIEKLEDLDREL